MSLKQVIADDMKAALLGGDRFRGDVLRNFKAAILNEEVAKQKREAGLDDAEVEALLAREVKKRKESIALYRENSRPDLAEPEEREVAVLETYLPEQIGEDELRELVQQKIEELGVSEPKQMGYVIGALKGQLGSSVDGGLLARLVKEALN